MITLDEVYRARKIISRHLQPTPLVYSRRLSRELEADVYLKLENLNPTHSFKVRGGIYYMSVMHERLRGVATASMGNHAQSVAYAGGVFDLATVVVMPSWVSEVKRRAVEELGARVIIHGSYYDEAAEYAQKYAEENGLTYLDAVNEERLYRGVATMHLEVVEALPDVDVVVNPVGGGSGAVGAVAVYKTVNPSVRVYGVQAEGAQAFYQSFKLGKPLATDGVNTRAEGLAVAKTYEKPFRLLKDRLDDVVLVSDEDMEKAVVKLLQYDRQVAELAGAASTAAAYKLADRFRGKKVVLNVTGGNIDPRHLAQLVSRHY
ncbi:MAG: pyridoxal-phosphate dependent enzyme [Candidatus Caldarchaeum sp.]